MFEERGTGVPSRFALGEARLFLWSVTQVREGFLTKPRFLTRMEAIHLFISEVA
jgi:hypothetical protein